MQLECRYINYHSLANLCQYIIRLSGIAPPSCNGNSGFIIHLRSITHEQLNRFMSDFFTLQTFFSYIIPRQFIGFMSDLL